MSKVKEFHLAFATALCLTSLKMTMDQKAEDLLKILIYEALPRKSSFSMQWEVVRVSSIQQLRQQKLDTSKEG